MEVTPLVSTRTLFPVYDQLRVEYDAASLAVWCFLNAYPRPCMTLQVLKGLKDFQARLRTVLRDPLLSREYPIKYMVVASSHPQFFSLGGDLALFRRLIQQDDKESLRAYAHDCVNLIFANATNLDAPLTTVAVVQGDALGGGFEAALSCNVIIAEHSARMGFPEILFNLVPGMGAYELLPRRTHPNRAEELMTSGHNYSAEDLRQFGVVDMVVPDGEGQQAARAFMRRSQRQQNARQLLQNFRARSYPISRQVMIDHTNLWVDAAMNLTGTELANMERLIAHQDSANTLSGKSAHVVTLDTDGRLRQQTELSERG